MMNRATVSTLLRKTGSSHHPTRMKDVGVNSSDRLIQAERTVTQNLGWLSVRLCSTKSLVICGWMERCR